MSNDFVEKLCFSSDNSVQRLCHFCTQSAIRQIDYNMN
nr:MAG TPA: hypothetical protein [Caudoviricetes sp.]